MANRSEKAKQYYLENKSYLKAKSLENYYRNQHKYSEYYKKYYQANKDKIRNQRGRVKRAEKKEKEPRPPREKTTKPPKEAKKIVLEKIFMEPFEYPTSSFSVSFA